MSDFIGNLLNEIGGRQADTILFKKNNIKATRDKICKLNIWQKVGNLMKMSVFLDKQNYRQFSLLGDT